MERNLVVRERQQIHHHTGLLRQVTHVFLEDNILHTPYIIFKTMPGSALRNLMSHNHINIVKPRQKRANTTAV